MTGWLILAILALGAGALAGLGAVRRQRRRDRRMMRRRRRIGYQRLWDQIMTRPRTKRLTFKDRDR